MSALDKARKFLEVAMQQELCKMMSSEFENINKLEVTPFMAVMRMIKLEYADSRPELYKMLVTVLHDYNPSGGPQHRHMTVKYINILLDSQPELADYLVNILPPVSTSTSSQHALHTMAGNTTRQQAEYTVNKRPLELVMDTGNILQMGAKKMRKQEPVKFYNFTTPAVNAYVASQGVPSKITSGPRPSTPSILPITSYMPGTTNILLPPIAESGKMSKFNQTGEIQVTPVISSVISLATEACAAMASVPNPLVRTFKPQPQNALVVATGSPQEPDRKQKLLNEQRRLLMVTDSFRKDCLSTDLSIVGINKVHMMTGIRASLGSVTGSMASPKGVGISKSVEGRGTSKKLIKKELGCSSTIPASALTLAKPIIPLQSAANLKASNGEGKSTAKSVTKPATSAMTLTESPGVKGITRNLASFPYSQQMLFSNGKKQNIVVNSLHQATWPTQMIESATIQPDVQTNKGSPRQPTEPPSRQPLGQAPGQQQESSLAAPTRTPLQCLQQMVENTGKDREVGYVDRIRDKLLNSIHNMDDTDVSSTTEPVTSVGKAVTMSLESGDITMSASKSDSGPAGGSCDERSALTEGPSLSVDGPTGQTSASRSDMLDTNSEEDIIVMNQYDGTSDCDSSVDPDTQSERSSPKVVSLHLTADGGFEPHSYLARLTDTPSPPNYSDPWGQQQGKTKEKKRSLKKKRRK